MRNRKGFTLIELLVAISIVGVLSSVVITSVARARMAARDMRRVTDIRQLKIALDMYFNDKGYYPPVNNDVNFMSCTANVDCWDKLGWVASYKSNEWNNKLGAQLAPYIQRMPIDPINASIIPDFDGGFSYLYGNVGRFIYPNTYDIFALFETPDHPLSCKFKKDHYGTGKGSWAGLCPESGGPYLSNEYYQNNYQ